jgi:Protein of unknown function (DUF3800)
MNAPVRATGIIRDLSVALFHRWEPERIFVILTSYFDESGTHDGSPATVMSGIMGTPSQWMRFQSEMDRIKKKYGFKVFHAKTFKAARGEFAGWKEEKYRGLLIEMGAAAARVMSAVSCSLPNDEYERDFRGGDKPKKLHLDSAYGLCFRYCLIHLILEVMRRLGNHKKFDQTRLHVVLESDHRNAGDAANRIFLEMQKELTRYNLNLLGTVTLADKDECDPLMIADFLSHGTLMMELAGDNYPPRDEIDLMASEKQTSMFNVKFEPGHLAALKSRLIDSLEARRAYGASQRMKRPTEETGS